MLSRQNCSKKFPAYVSIRVQCMCFFMGLREGKPHFENIPFHLEPSGAKFVNLWQFLFTLVSFGNLWQFLAASGNLWQLVATFSIFFWQFVANSNCLSLGFGFWDLFVFFLEFCEVLDFL